MPSDSNNIIKVLFVILFLIILGALYSQFSPLEKLNQSYDAQQTEYGQGVLEAIIKFNRSRGDFPWTGQLGRTEADVPFEFTEINNPIVGICSDENCQKAGKLSEYVSNTFPVPKLKSESYVGRDRDTLYYCYLPMSESTRKKTGILKSFEPGKDFSPGRCTARVNWEEDVCYICLEK